MNCNEIQDKELKTVLHLLDLLQNSRNLSEEEARIYNALHASFPVIADEKSVIYDYIHSYRWIEAPESFPNDQGGMDVFPIESSIMHPHIRITPLGDKEIKKLLPFARNWLYKKEKSEEFDKLHKHLLESQLESIKFAQKTTEETINIAKSAKSAAWASAFSAIITAILALVALIFSLYK